MINKILSWINLSLIIILFIGLLIEDNFYKDSERKIQEFEIKLNEHLQQKDSIVINVYNDFHVK